jgi:hypothetical protein
MRFAVAVKVGLLAVAALALTPVANPQEDSGSLDLAGIAHVAIRTTNMAGTRAFFQKLGFVQAFDLTKNGVATEDFIKISGSQFVELYPVQEGSRLVSCISATT